MKNKKASIKGEVVTEPSIWTANSGTACCKFSVRTTDGIYECIGFHERAKIDGLALGCTVAIRGSYRDTDAFEGKTITVDTAIVEGQREIHVDAITKEYGSVAKWREMMAVNEQRKVSEGYIYARFTEQKDDGKWLVRRGWFQRQWCTQHPGTKEWWLSIELCMNVLGSDAVSRTLIENEININKGLTRYRDVLDGMLLQVSDTLENGVPF